MTIEQKKQYLKRYKHAKHEIESLEDVLNTVRMDALPGGIDYSKDKVQTTPTNDQMINHIIKVKDLEEKIYNLICEADDVRNEIIDCIAKQQNRTYKAILYRRYISLQQWDEIASIMGYSIQWVYLTHAEALSELVIEKV